MNSSCKVPATVIKRLSVYYRYLCDLEMKGFLRITSKELATRLGVNASQIRLDLNCFGEFGLNGYGYCVPELCSKIGEILGLVRHYKVVIIGACNIGHAFANYSHFKALGFDACAMFDNSPKLCKNKMHNVEILSIDNLNEFLENNTIDIAVICSYDRNTQNICDLLIDGGIKGILNFTQLDISTTTAVPISNIHLSDTLLELTYYMQDQDK